MRNEEQELRRGKHAAMFIAAAMLLALVYMLGQFDWSGGVADERTPPPLKASTAAYRIGVQWPAGDYYSDADVKALARGFGQSGVKWVLYRIPLWTPTARRAEYGKDELAHHGERIAALRGAGFRVIAAPVYWNGAALTPGPEPAMSKEFFLTYRELALDMAGFADEHGVEALLLDGNFGHPSISAAEWLELISSLRTVYSGKLEIRVDDGLTPGIYARHFDGVYLGSANGTIDESAVTAAAEGGTAVYILATDTDAYTDGAFPWQPSVSTEGASEETTNGVLALADAYPQLRCIVLSGIATIDALRHTEHESPLGGTLRSLRQRTLQQDIERTQKQLTIDN
jgi:hypothetical protein